MSSDGSGDYGADDSVEVMSGGACTPPLEANTCDSPTDSLFESPRALLKQLYHANEAAHNGGTASSSSHHSHRSFNPPPIASRKCPPIPGLLLFPDLISTTQADQTLRAILASFDLSSSSDRNQVMLFGRARSAATSTMDNDDMNLMVSEAQERGGPPSKRRKLEAGIEAALPAPSTGLPIWMDDLLVFLNEALRPLIPQDLHSLLFANPPGPSNARNTVVMNAQGCSSRQVIINTYAPGQGISPHIDLLQRFGDGILICSFIGATVMDFSHQALEQQPSGVSVQAERVSMDVDGSTWAPVATEGQNSQSGTKFSVFLPARSVAILHGSARYEWTHGIEGRLVDRVEPPAWAGSEPVAAEGQDRLFELVPRTQRLSVTIRWLLPGADVVGS